MKAKSRLKSAPVTIELPRVETPPPVHVVSTTSSDHHPHKLREKLTPVFHEADRELPLKYFKHLSTLLLCLPFYAALYFIVTNYHPDQLKNFLFPNWYLGFQIPFFWGNFFLLSFLLLNTRRGLTIALTLQLLVFLKLQSVVITWQIILFLIIFYVASEFMTYLISKTSSNEPASIKPKRQFIPRRSRSIIKR